MKLGKKFTKSLTAILLAVSMVAAPIASVAAVEDEGYTDIPDNHWAKEALEEAIDRGIMKGYGDGTIRPDLDIIRAEFATMAVQYKGYEEKADLSVYTDVKESDWFYTFIEKAVAAGVMVGKSETIMAPMENIKREEAFRVIAATAGLEGDGENLEEFADADQVSSWAKEAVSGLVEAGIIVGHAGEERLLEPQGELTRAEAAVMLIQLLKYEEGEPEEPEESEKTREELEAEIKEIEDLLAEAGEDALPHWIEGLEKELAELQEQLAELIAKEEVEAVEEALKELITKNKNNELTLEDEEAVNKAIEAYNKLTDEQRRQIPLEVRNDFKDVIEKMAELLEEKPEELAELKNNATNELVAGLEKIYVELDEEGNVTSVKYANEELVMELPEAELTFEGKNLKVEDLNKIDAKVAEQKEAAEQKAIEDAILKEHEDAVKAEEEYYDAWIAEALKINFLEAAEKQGSTNGEVYTIEFDGTNLKVEFIESGITGEGKDPVETVKTQAEAMMDKVLLHADKVTVTVGEKVVEITKDNKNIVELAKAFLGEQNVAGFLKGEEAVEVSFKVVIEKYGVTADLGEFSSNFSMKMNSTENVEKVEEAIAEVKSN